MFQKRVIFFILAAVIIGCGAQFAFAQSIKPVASLFTPQDYPRVDGSTSTQPLSDLILARCLGFPSELRRLYILAGSERNLTVVFPIQTDLAQMKIFQKAQSKIRHRGTDQSYTALIEDKCDLILVARRPSDDELKLAREKRVTLDARPIALDAFVFILNAANSINSLSINQLRKIYTGEIKNWNNLGGIDKEIIAYTRQPNSGSQELMEKLVLQGMKIRDIRGGLLETMGAPIDAVSVDSAAIAYSVYYYEEIMYRNPQCKLLAVSGVLPSAKTIANRSYPLVSEVYVVTRKDIPENGPAAKLRAWLLSRKGQNVVAESGYVPFRK